MPAATLPRIDAAALVERLERAHSPSDRLLAFDCDGTLWRGDISEALFAALLEDAAFRPAAVEALAAEASAHAIAVDARDANALARALHRAHAAGNYPEQRCLEMMAWVYAGWSLGELDAVIDDLFRRVDFAGWIRPELRRVLDWAAQQRLPVWAVSATPEFLVVRAAALLDIPPERVLGMPTAQDGDRLLPRLAGTPTYREGKLTRLQEATGGAPLLAAFGDSPYDAALLEAARVRVAVAPTPALRALSGRIPDLVELATT